MTTAGAARLGAYLLVVLVVAGTLVWNADARPTVVGWREALQRTDTALAGGDPRAARQAWEQAYRAAIAARTPEGLLAVGEVAHDRFADRPSARRAFLRALLQARERRDAPGVAAAAAAFASLGDREVADRGFAIAAALASDHGSVATRERVAVREAGAAR